MAALNRDADFDWNRLQIENADGPNVPLETSSGGEIRLCSKDSVEPIAGSLANRLANWMRDADLIVGCFAWLTNFRVLDSLAAVKYGCQIVVQKEDFLRPDRGHSAKSTTILHRKYSAMKCRIRRIQLPYANELSVGSDDLADPVRCAGRRGDDRRKAVPRMHHKFAVKCRVREVSEDSDGYREVSPMSVWTGSFNPTLNGTASRENAVIINSEAVADFYAREWACVFAMSEQLNWQSEWVCPEYRIGT